MSNLWIVVVVFYVGYGLLISAMWHRSFYRDDSFSGVWKHRWAVLAVTLMWPYVAVCDLTGSKWWGDYSKSRKNRS